MSKIATLGVAMATALFAHGAGAAELLDQSDVPTTPTYITSYETDGWGSVYAGLGQTFTVGTGGLLSRISAGVTNTGTAPVAATLTLFAGAPDQFGNLTSTLLYSEDITLPVFSPVLDETLDWSTLPSWDVSAGDIKVTPGEQLMFTITLPQKDPDIGELVRAGSWSGVYSGGELYFGLDPIYAYAHPAFGETAFQTYVTVPEPASWSLLILGAGLAGAQLRRRRVVRVA